jgi:hypothetical protein
MLAVPAFIDIIGDEKPRNEKPAHHAKEHAVDLETI